MYVEWDKLIPALEKHFPGILDEILKHDIRGLLQQTVKNSPPALGIATQTHDKHKDHPALDFCNQELEVEPNVMAAFATTHQRYLTVFITIF